jgi:hypothetical protein
MYVCVCINIHGICASWWKKVVETHDADGIRLDEIRSDSNGLETFRIGAMNAHDVSDDPLDPARYSSK